MTLIMMVLLCLQVLNICIEMMDEVIPSERAARDFRVKFPDDVMQENLAGQLWFGAEVRITSETPSKCEGYVLLVYSR